ncbi:hypothetical protein ACFRMQ_20640 [Kitasatospora sp. NPDC056783]|uniref:hypothetical protein n=1 Tax=Kitasatospora sp. NPDC056783 TaxID=3345943 RepID=UPI0036D0F7E7
MDDAFTLGWQYSAGLVTPEDLPMAAANLLAEGIGGQSSALCDLAGRPGRGESSAELEELLWQAMAELGLPVPDDAFVERAALHHAAARLTSGEITAAKAFGRLRWISGGDLTDAERRLLSVTDEPCCEGCFESWPSAVRQEWERELKAAALDVVSAPDHAPTASWYRD